MASHGAMLGSSATCLSCLRKIANSLAGSTISAGTVAILSQTRAKSRFKRPQDKGVIVRLLEDIPKFGRKDAIFRVERGRMRNQWYPKNKAEYMTTTRFQQLGLSRSDIGERDRLFVPTPQGQVKTVQASASPPPSPPPSAPTPVAPAPEPVLKPEPPKPEKARKLMLALLPQKITFLRKTISAPKSPATTDLDGATQLNEPSRAIFGSVTTVDIASRVKELLAATPDANLIPIEPDNIRFVDLENDTDRIKTLGMWQVDILVDVLSQTEEGEPIRRTIEVLADE